MRKRFLGAFVVAVVGVLLVAVFAATVRGAATSTSDVGSTAREPMDLVWISDSVGWGVAGFYAEHIREDLGVAVRAQDRWEGDLTAATVLQRLRTPKHRWIRLIRNAEVIFVSGNSYGLYQGKGGNCVSTGCKRPITYGPRAHRQYIAVLKAIYRRIFEIRNGRPVIMRTNNWYAPAISQPPNSLFYEPVSWKSCGIVDLCTKCFERLSWAISRAAGPYHVRVADVYTAFNGPDHREDPVAKGYIQEDGIHVSDAGRAVFAQTLADLGYEPARPPR
jgi:hypothetical protein